MQSVETVAEQDGQLPSRWQRWRAEVMAGKGRISLLPMLLMCILLMCGSSFAFFLPYNDVAKYQCYAHAFWFGGSNYPAVPSCDFIQNTASGAAVSYPAAGVSGAGDHSVLADAADPWPLVSDRVRGLDDLAGGWHLLVSGTLWPTRLFAGVCRLYRAGRVCDGGQSLRSRTGSVHALLSGGRGARQVYLGLCACWPLL